MRVQTMQNRQQNLGDTPPEEFRKQLHELADWIADFRQNLEALKVAPNEKPGAILAALPAKAGPMDAACEAIHGISAACDVAVSSLRARRATRPGRSDLGELLFVGDQHRVLDERRVHFANSISRKANCRARYHARDRARERRLFYRREI